MIRKRFKEAHISIILLSLLSISICHSIALSGEMIPVLDVYSDSTNSRSYEEYNLIDGSGLSDDYHDNQYENMWMGKQYELPTLTFDLGSVYTVFELKIWQYNYDHFSYLLDRGVKDFNVYGSIDNIYGTLLFSGTLTKSPGGRILSESFPVSEDVRYLQIQIASNYGEDYTGLSEVQIFGTESEDNDSDGLPDSWENYYYLDPYFDDSLIDTDGDGINNLDEYLDASNPQNNVPNQPTLLFPVNSQDDVSLTPILRSNAFIDPDANDTHAYTHWQISLE